MGNVLRAGPRDGEPVEAVAFTFTPSKDIKAFIMFVVNEVGTVDLAGITASDVESAK